MSDLQKQRLGILWFRNDLRLNDNLSLDKTIHLVKEKKLDLVLPIYCFDKLLFEGRSREAQLPKLGPFRRNFLIESVENLKEKLQKKLNSNLCILYGEQDVEIKKLIEKILTENPGIHIEYLIASREVPSDEVDLENKVKKYLDSKRIKNFFLWDNLMIHPDDLPFGHFSKTPDMFTQFRKSVELKESNYNVRKSVQIESNFSLPTFSQNDIVGQSIPEKAKITESPKSAILGMKGGEDQAELRMQQYFFKTDGLFKYKTTRNGLVGTEYSSKLSMWLALGCISPRYLYWKVKEFETMKCSNESTKCLAFELLWRDFFKYHSLKFGKRIFYQNGCYTGAAGYQMNWKKDQRLFEKWINGETGYPFVDANMKELKETGWMSNRGRQNVASFLTKDLEIDWRFGAEYFETMLIDYDCTSNWGNWQYVAGVGTDPRADRYFNVIKQAYDYDQNGEFVKLWIPALQNVSDEFVHCPFRMSLVEQKSFNCILNKDYPLPIVQMKHKWNPYSNKANKFAARQKRAK
ncbi:cryptochrome DASH-like [Brachionus plicatilis]|uniref:Cryptochrome DASH n=1 Tax=Brachionus plicatilis TaxID=10195 RepID=A0A3M7R0F8_BRAPC|nr:cryptochrome DASH-like [Brachionus plicatilis]